MAKMDNYWGQTKRRSRRHNNGVTKEYLRFITVNTTRLLHTLNINAISGGFDSCFLSLEFLACSHGYSAFPLQKHALSKHCFWWCSAPCCLHLYVYLSVKMYIDVAVKVPTFGTCLRLNSLVDYANLTSGKKQMLFSIKTESRRLGIGLVTNHKTPIMCWQPGVLSCDLSHNWPDQLFRLNLMLHY